MEDLSARAEHAGYAAVVLTVDNWIRGHRRRMALNGYRLPADALNGSLRRYGADEWQRAHPASDEAPLDWASVEWFRSTLRVPFVLKGVMTPEDARRAVDAGVDAVMVSNHGGRQLDGEPGTVEVLEGIVQAVAGRVQVLLDGGVRRSTDIAIALGLGASAVGLGSPVVWAYACGGEEVAAAFLADLIADLSRTLGSIGCACPRQVTRAHVSRRGEYIPDSELGPFLPRG